LKKQLAILGSTGSIGRQALSLIESTPKQFSIELLSAHSNFELIIKQARFFKPKTIVITEKQAFDQVYQALDPQITKVYFGEERLLEALESSEIEVVLNAISGFAGLRPLIHSIEHKKEVLLANKESLVVAGELIMPLIYKNKLELIPIDSEPSAIFQCLRGESKESIDKVILTASGGPFLEYTTEQLKHITAAQALKHPIWEMGDKVSIDSASLMNKGLEIIEARWLFDLQPEQIDLIIHPQSIIHSLVQFTDGSLKAQIGSPDMRIPIQYALHYPKRSGSNIRPFSFLEASELTFQQVDHKKFRNLALAYEAMKQGGNMPAILNAANEIAVRAFLEGRWPFYRIHELVAEMMNQQDYYSEVSLTNYFETTKKCFADSEAYIRNHA
jgi:1-deoxy-D-xylulose-5-phosphate reductoisomerase